MTAKQRKEREAESIAQLKSMLKPGDTIWSIFMHVNSMGDSRRFKFVIPHKFKNGYGEDKTIVYDLTWHIANACGYRYNEHQRAIVVGGGGMDMAYSVVYNLSSVLNRGGFKCIGDKCPSNDHTNGMPYPDGAYNGEKHKDGGYALIKHDI